MNKKAFLSTIFFVMVFIGSYVMIHETTHQRIYAIFGVNSTLGFEWRGFTTTPNETEIKALPQEQQNALGYLQAETEIFGYHLFAIYLGLTSILFVFIIKR